MPLAVSKALLCFGLLYLPPADLVTGSLFRIDGSATSLAAAC